MGNTTLKKTSIFRRKFPTHLQFDQTDCGATCVKIILDYHGIKVPLSHIKEICFTDLQGANILDVSNALKHFNFEVVTVKIDVDSLVENKDALPPILLFDNNHYVVLYKITKKGFTFRILNLESMLSIANCSSKDGYQKMGKKAW